MAQWVRSWDLATHTSLLPIRRGFAPSFVNYKKGALDSEPQVIKFTSCLPGVGRLRMDKQYNGQKRKYKGTNNDLQNTTQETKWSINTHSTKISCSIRGTRRVNLATNPVISQKRKDKGTNSDLQNTTQKTKRQSNTNQPKTQVLWKDKKVLSLNTSLESSNVSYQLPQEMWYYILKRKAKSRIDTSFGGLLVPGV